MYGVDEPSSACRCARWLLSGIKFVCGSTLFLHIYCLAISKLLLIKTYYKCYGLYKGGSGIPKLAVIYIRNRKLAKYKSS